MDNKFLKNLQQRITTDSSSLATKTSAIGAAVLKSVIDRISSNIDNQGKLLPISRSQKGSVPVASLKNGGVLMSDGTTRGTPDINLLTSLKRNVLSQNYFTPQAKAYLEKMPINYGVTKSNNLGQYNPNTKSIGINPKLIKMISGTIPSEVLTHEFLHALDANLNSPYEASIKPGGKNSGDSYKFYPKINSTMNHYEKRGLNSFLSSYAKDPYVYDTESFAQYAAPKGQKVLLKPSGNAYENIFVPASRAINFSPLFPTLNTFEDIFKSFDQENNI